MGAPSTGTAGPAPVRFYLSKVRLDSGGYDASGAYWGSRMRGYSLWRYETRNGDDSGYRDARNRDQAKAQIRLLYPNATFFR